MTRDSASRSAEAPEPDVVRDVLLHAAALMMAAGYAVPLVEDKVEKLAVAYGVPRARIVILPTVTFVSIPGRESARVEVETVRDLALRLDQTAELGRVLNLADRGELTPAEALRLLDSVLTMRPRRGRLVRIAGYALLTIGVGLMLRPTPIELAAIAALGALVGCLVQISARRLQLDYLMPVLAATLVAAAACIVAEVDDEANATRMIIPPLVTFLPAAIIAMAIIDLTANELISGSSRLVLGIVKLVLLSIGIVAGAEIVGAAPQLFEHAQGDSLGRWAPWVGVLAFGCGVYLHHSAPRGSLPWLLLVLLVAWLGQLLGQRLFGSYLSGFTGSLAMTPTALLVERRPSAPAAQVLFLPAFWMLVPGAIGLVGVTELVGEPRTASELQGSIVSFVAIALGVYFGGALFLAAATARQTYRHALRRTSPRR